MPARPTAPNPENASPEALATAIRAAATQRSQRRLMAVKTLILGVPFPTVMRIHEVSHRTLARWIAAFNRYGIDGLIEGERTGRPPALPAELAPELCRTLEEPERAGQLHWTGRKFHGHLTRTLGLEVGYSTLMRFVHEQGFRLKVPQPWPDRQDQALRQAFCERLRGLLEDREVDLWFCDESGFEGDPRPRRRFIKVGQKGRVTRNGDHLRMNAAGMVCPRTGQAFMLEFTHCDADVFQVFLDEANRDLALERPRNVLVCDNASWHKVKRLDWGRFEPLWLPPYSPDLNPIERLWLLIKLEWFADFVARDRAHLVERLDQALAWAIDRAADNQKTCAIKTEL